VYAFPVTLSQAIQDRGHEVEHTYCDSLITTPFGVCNGSIGFTLPPVQTSRPLNKYNLVRRWIREQEYGRRVTRAILNSSPDYVTSANAALSAQERVLRLCKQNCVPLVFWFQDLIGLATSRVLKSKLSTLSSVSGRCFQSLEGGMLRKSDAIIAITEDFILPFRSLGFYRIAAL